VLLGAITGAHGLRGEVVLKIFTETPEAIAAYGPLQSEDGAVTVEIEGLRPVKGGFAARLKGVTDRNGAEALKGVGLYAPRAALGEPGEEDEFFHADLIGLEVFEEGKGRIGTVTAVPDFGAGGLLEIALKGRKGTVLLPFTREAVPEVDLPGGRVVVVPPEGLWDENGTPEREEDAGG
jgi:16S rRNA processing protein RimM